MEYLHHVHSARGIALAAIAHPLLLQAWIPSFLDLNGWDPPSWSLSNEALFYLLFPALLLALGWRSLRFLCATAVSMWIIFLTVPAALIVVGTTVLGNGHSSPWWWTRLLWFVPVLRLPEFVLGMGVGLLFMKRSAPASDPVASRMHWSALSSLILVPVLLILLAVNYPFPDTYPLGAIVDPFLALFIFSLAYGRGPVAYILSRPLMCLLGEASYAIYILHWPIWYWTARFGPSLLHVPQSSHVLGAVYFSLVLSLSILSFLLIERPARAAIRARFAHSFAGRPGTAFRVAPAE